MEFFNSHLLHSKCPEQGFNESENTWRKLRLEPEMRAYAATFEAINQYHLTPKWKARLIGAIGHVTVGYTCGLTYALSQSMREAVLASPSFDVQSNVWKISLK